MYVNGLFIKVGLCINMLVLFLLILIVILLVVKVVESVIMLFVNVLLIYKMFGFILVCLIVNKVFVWLKFVVILL